MTKPDLNACYDHRDGDPHHIAAMDADIAYTWPEIVFTGIVVVVAGAFVWWLS
jgi:hypothetical protein